MAGDRKGQRAEGDLTGAGCLLHSLTCKGEEGGTDPERKREGGREEEGERERREWEIKRPGVCERERHEENERSREREINTVNERSRKGQ